jgi:hypothetical protein
LTIKIGGGEVPYSEAQKRASRKYNEKAYDRIELKVFKGQKATYKTHAAELGESLNSFIVRAMEEQRRRDESENNDCRAPAPSGAHLSP